MKFLPKSWSINIFSNRHTSNFILQPSCKQLKCFFDGITWHISCGIIQKAQIYILSCVIVSVFHLCHYNLWSPPGPRTLIYTGYTCEFSTLKNTPFIVFFKSKKWPFFLLKKNTEILRMKNHLFSWKQLGQLHHCSSSTCQFYYILQALGQSSSVTW